MNFINRPRGNGKTASMIVTSYITGIPLVVKTEKQREHVLEVASKMDCPIDVFTVQEVREKHIIHNEDILIDECYSIVGDAIDEYLGCHVIAGTMSVPMRGVVDDSNNNTRV